MSGHFTTILDARETSQTESVPEQSPQKLKIHGIQKVIQGALLFFTGALLGVPLALFSTDSDWHSNWILIWLIFCGWIPVMGAVMLGGGISSLIHSRMRRNEIDGLRPASDTGKTLWTGEMQHGEMQQGETGQIINPRSPAAPAPLAADRTTTPGPH
jgi:hypothetical protein